ncbi:MAG TPA: hypothetical protein VNM40_03545 [Candidatus Paceibacterota bacterium]|nr:hypothetical protein [Candidatus Paceibacterota bacterium]
MTLREKAAHVLGKAVGDALRKGIRHPMCPPPQYKQRRSRGFNRSNNRKLERVILQHTDRPRHL